MSSAAYTEYRNQNAHRNYPFADDASLKDMTGSALPLDFLLDAYLYPIDLDGDVYLGRIATGDNKIYFYDDITNEAFGYAVLTNVASTQYVRDISYDRIIGVVVYGDGVQQILYGATDRLFNAVATQLCAAAFVSMNQPGVRGFKVNDKIFSGFVTFEGENGMRVYSDSSNLYFDAIGIPATDEEDKCSDELCPPIRTLRFEQVASSPFCISNYGDGTLAIQAAYSLTDICDGQRKLQLPDENGYLPLNCKPGDNPCEGPPIPPTPPTPCPATSVEYKAVDCNAINIITPSATGYLNPVSVQCIDTFGSDMEKRVITPIAGTMNVKDVSDLIEQFRDPPFLTGGLRIGIIGTRQAKRGKK